jgi:hypothetical protein
MLMFRVEGQDLQIRKNPKVGNKSFNQPQQWHATTRTATPTSKTCGNDTTTIIASNCNVRNVAAVTGVVELRVERPNATIIGMHAHNKSNPAQLDDNDSHFKNAALDCVSEINKTRTFVVALVVAEPSCAFGQSRFEIIYGVCFTTSRAQARS